MGMIKRAIGFNASEKVSRSLFTALVRSDVEYGSSLWSGTSKRNLQLIEGIQKRATNYILNYPNLDYRERLPKLKRLPLSFRREIIDLTFFLKCKLELNCVTSILITLLFLTPPSRTVPLPDHLQ